MNIWLWVLLAFVCGLVAGKVLELCKILLQRVRYFRLEIGLGGAEAVDSRKQVGRAAPHAGAPGSSLRGSRARAALKHDNTSGETGED